MKKGLSTEVTYDAAGNWMLIVRKERGKLTLEDIREAAMECEQEYYALILKCIDEDMSQYWEDDLRGDVAAAEPQTFWRYPEGRR
ncbi:MAG: hypothetical protein V8S58_05575 [Lachnospiraceae bacterium]